MMCYRSSSPLPLPLSWTNINFVPNCYMIAKKAPEWKRRFTTIRCCSLCIDRIPTTTLLFRGVRQTSNSCSCEIPKPQLGQQNNWSLIYQDNVKVWQWWNSGKWEKRKCIIREEKNIAEMVENVIMKAWKRDWDRKNSTTMAKKNVGFGYKKKQYHEQKNNTTKIAKIVFPLTFHYVYSWTTLRVTFLLYTCSLQKRRGRVLRTFYASVGYNNRICHHKNEILFDVSLSLYSLAFPLLQRTLPLSIEPMETIFR